MTLAWVKYQYQFVTVTGPAHSEVESRTWVNLFAGTLDSSGRIPGFGARVGQAGIVPAPAGTASIVVGSAPWHLTFHFGADNQIVAVDQLIVLKVVTEVVTDPTFDPGPLIGGTFSYEFPDAHGGPYTFTQPQFEWVRTEAVVTDLDGNGYDDRGEHDSQTSGLLAPIWNGQDSPNGNEDSLVQNLLDFFASHQGEFDSVEGIAGVSGEWGQVVGGGFANQARILQRLSAKLSAVGLAVDLLDLEHRIAISNDPAKTAFVESALLAERLVAIEVGAVVGTAIATPVGGVVAAAGMSYLFTTGLESRRRAQLENFWDAHHPPQGQAHAAQAAADNSEAFYPAIFDVSYYLSTYADAAAAVRDGSAASAFAHYLAVGLAAGYRPSAITDPLDPATVLATLQGSAAAGPRNDLFVVALGNMAGDGLSSDESMMASLLRQTIGGTAVASAALTALANRYAVDLFANYSSSAFEMAQSKALPTTFSTSSGFDARETFGSIDFADLRLFAAAGAWISAQDAFNAVLGSGIVGPLSSGQAIGVGEFGGVWVVIVGQQARSDTAVSAEASFTLTHYGGAEADILIAGTRAADFVAMEGDDSLIGGNFADHFWGGSGRDILVGNGGADLLVAGDGNDILRGGRGTDVMEGEAGSDTFVFASPVDSSLSAMRSDGKKHLPDRIEDFTSGVDRIDLSGVDAISGTGSNDAFDFIGQSAFGGHAGELRYDAQGDRMHIYGDIDGNGFADFEIIATGTTIVAGDFIL